MKIDNIDQALAAVERRGYVLQYVPDSLRTAEVCREAVQQYGRALAYVPEPQRTVDLCRAAVRQDGSALQYVPDSRRTEEVCLAAVERRGYVLQYVPDSRRTEEVCWAAVRQDERALAYVPVGMITVGMIIGTGDSRSVIDVYGDLVLTRELADEADDVCDDGIDLWIDQYCAEDETITVADALATGDRLMHVCRVIAVAIRRRKL